MWTPIRLTDKTTGRHVYISIFEGELYLAGVLNFEDLWQMEQQPEQLELNLNCEVAVI